MKVVLQITSISPSALMIDIFCVKGEQLNFKIPLLFPIYLNPGLLETKATLLKIYMLSVHNCIQCLNLIKRVFIDKVDRWCFYKLYAHEIYCATSFLETFVKFLWSIVHISCFVVFFNLYINTDRSDQIQLSRTWSRCSDIETEHLLTSDP